VTAPELLATLPADLQGSLLAAALVLDPGQTLEIIDSITDSSLAAALRTLVENFEFQRMLTLLEDEGARKKGGAGG